MALSVSSRVSSAEQGLEKPWSAREELVMLGEVSLETGIRVLADNLNKYISFKLKRTRVRERKDCHKKRAEKET